MTIGRGPALTIAIVLGLTAACGSGDSPGSAAELTDASASEIVEVVPDTGTADKSMADATTPAASTTPSTADSPAERGILSLTVGPQGNEARYRVREQLVGFDLPNDAIGRTSRVTGTLVLDPSGRFLEGSTIEVNITGLQSDQDRRDRYIQGRILMGEQYPTVRLAPRELRGFSQPLPTSGTARGELLGDLTVLEVTRPTVWNVEARFSPDRVTGTASTAFTFEDFQITKPQVRTVLSVADTIRLEYDFDFTVGSGGG